MTKSTSTQVKIDKDQIDLVITVIEVTCKTLLSLISILKGIKRNL